MNDPASRRRARYEQARILGGGSSINGLCANRGAPTDHDSWEQLGATGWNFESALPYFRKLERDLDFDGAYHGKDGPITIRRYPVEDWAGFVGTVAKVLQSRGLPLVPDQNGKWVDGVMPVAVFQSASICVGGSLAGVRKFGQSAAPPVALTRASTSDAGGDGGEPVN